MYFVTCLYNGKEQLGVLNQEKTGVIFLHDLHMDVKAAYMLELVDHWREELLEEIKKGIADVSPDKIVPLENVKLQAPIPYPRRNVFCLGKNYMDHAKEIGTVLGGKEDIPEYPIYFSKVAAPAIGDRDFVDSHRDIETKLDYEVELAVIIGKEGKNIRKEEAEDYIFGYTILNDISARGLQKVHSQWHRGKSLDTFCPMGPYLVHKSVLPFPVELDITCKVNGELRQNSNTRNLIFDIPTILHDLSRGMTLKPGDIIATGTPAGVGMGFQPFKFLNPGDVVECSIEKIGVLTNTIK
ncbi:MAG: fumarylacetoacetate hydrolase family protein [Bacillota bacterium]